MQAIYAKKIGQSQKFLENGARIPVTEFIVPQTFVLQEKTTEKDGYQAIQIGVGSKKRANKPLLGKIKKIDLKTSPAHIKEIPTTDTEHPEPGTELITAEILKPGDIVQVTGISKGKGFQGGVKRHGFAGGPKTHGQSDRHRAPGSIGQGTTPGRVYKGKKMAGHMGHEQVSVDNLKVVQVDENKILIKGLVPGGKNNMVLIRVTGEDKKFIPLHKTAQEILADEEAKAKEEKIMAEEAEKAKLEEAKTRAENEKSENKEDTVVEEKVEAKKEEA